LGYTECESDLKTVQLTSDHQCVVVAESKKAKKATMPEVEKLLAAKKLLNSALRDEYLKSSCDPNRATFVKVDERFFKNC
jgi:hypothetical protein